MPELKNERPFKRYILPSSTKKDPAWVELWSKFNTGDMVEVQESNAGNARAGILALVKLIKDWNFTENGKKAVISEENINCFEFEDTEFLLEKAEAIQKYVELSKVKKNS